MHDLQIATPFGRRPMTLALVKRQVQSSQIAAGKKADKWKIFRDVSEARVALDLHDRSLAVLDALLSFYPDNELREDAKLIVFPSNAQLTIRAHGIAGATLRRHLALLVEAGLIVRKDSANGKRYARRDTSGDVDSAFGFDISPLLARSEELALVAQQVAADRAEFRAAKEDVTIRRRNVRKLISAAMEEGAPGDWMRAEEAYVTLVSKIPRNPSLSDLKGVLDEMEILMEEVLNMLDAKQDSQNISTNDAHSERHIQNSKSESFNEIELAQEKEQGEKPEITNTRTSLDGPSFPLGLVLRACPDIEAYAPGGKIGTWRDLMTAAVVVRSMLGVSPSAYQDACESMGPEDAAATIACILERAVHINSPGGYLRDLTARANRGQFSLGPALMAQLRSSGGAAQRAG